MWGPRPSENKKPVRNVPPNLPARRSSSAAGAESQRNIQSVGRRGRTVMTTCLAGLLRLDGVEEIVGRLDRLAIDGHDHVGGGPIDRLILGDERACRCCFFSIRGPCSPARSAGPPGAITAISSPRSV